MNLVVGLGNPGKAYEHTRHNIGVMVLDEMARRRGLQLKKIFCFPARQAIGTARNHEELRMLAPTTYMNRSGETVWRALKKWRIKADSLVVVYDDVDLELGTLRVRRKGSAGTHNGMKSVLEWMKTDELARVRVGIGPRPTGEKMIDFVLGPFSGTDNLKVEKVVEKAADAVESLVSGDVDRTMNAFNRPPEK